MRVAAAAVACAAAWWAPEPARATSDGSPVLPSCRLRGVEHPALCGRLARPLDPQQPNAARIELHFAVLPALSRSRKPDPVFFFAGGPGQSAIDLAGTIARLLARFAHRRDIVLIDQRGTGRSAPLLCEDRSEPARPLAESLDADQVEQRVAACRQRLQRLPHGDLRQFTTPIAVQDVEAVRQHLKLGPVNLIGVSYGTRVALDYLRQYPQAVRRVVLDGVAPPDQALPWSYRTDGEAALQATVAACAAEPACARRHPNLVRDLAELWQGLPRLVEVAHPVTGAVESLTLTPTLLAGVVRSALYAPVIASALPEALAQAQAGRYGALFGLAAAVGGGAGPGLAQGQHLAVLCSEDLPLAQAAAAAAGAGSASAATPSALGDSLLAQYRSSCAGWPRATLPAGFTRLPTSPVPVLLLSGGLDPVTPPRHAERVARALGGRAQQVVIAQAGHGLLALACVRERVFRFVDADTAGPAAAAAAEECELPRPPFVLPMAGPAASGAPAGRDAPPR